MTAATHAQQDADQVGLGAAGGHADEHHARERDRDAHDQPPREPLAQQQSGEHRDQDRADVDQHRRRAGVQVLLGGVERHVVDAEPAHAADGEQRPLPRGGPHPARPARSRPSTAVPISSRPRASAPGEKSSPTPRMATKADAQASSVTRRRRAASGGAAGLGSGVRRCSRRTLGDGSTFLRRFPDSVQTVRPAAVAGRTAASSPCGPRLPRIVRSFSSADREDHRDRSRSPCRRAPAAP